MRTQKLFAAIGLVAVLVVLGGAAYKVVGPAPAEPVRKGVAKPISELSINRHFSLNLGSVGRADGTGSVPPFVATMPPSAGFAIAQLFSDGNLRKCADGGADCDAVMDCP